MTAPIDDPDHGAETSDDVSRQAAAAKNAEVAFRAHYREIVPKLAAYLIVAYNASRREAAECAHEALVDYHRHHDEVRHPLGWCRRAARSVYLKRAFDALESFAEVPATGAPLYADDHADDQEHRDTLLSLIPELPPRQREVVALLLEGLGYDQIAAELNVEEATIRSHARHGRDRLAELYRNSRQVEGDQ